VNHLGREDILLSPNESDIGAIVRRNILIAFLVMRVLLAISFRKVIELPSGRTQKGFCFDTDQDGRQNLVFGAYADQHSIIQFWEHIGFDRYILEDTAEFSQLYDIGFLDGDSLVDMVGNHNGLWPYPLYVYESPTQYSNPTDIVWQDSGFENICGGYITDLDQDGRKEILFRYSLNNGSPRTCVYENTGENEYDKVWEDTMYRSGCFVDGDFDLDGRIEFWTGRAENYGGHVLAWECVGDNSYQLIFNDTLPRNNNHDIFASNDMDGNNKPEFLFTCYNPSAGKAWLYTYESIGDDLYGYFLVDSIAGIWGAMFEQRSCCGDVDADGIEEIVWSTFNQWHIYKAIGVHQYQKIYSSTWYLHDIKIVNVYDLNENGYPEVIETWYRSGNPPTHSLIICEIEGVRLHQPNGGEVLQPGQQYTITWEKFDPPGADSFSLFVSYNNGLDYQTITTIGQSDDTMYLWTVSDIVSDSCKIMVWAYGPPRLGEQVPRGTAWDFSDSVFTISEIGVTEARSQIQEARLQIIQNPVLDGNLRFRYTLSKPSKARLVLYNALGQVEEVLVDKMVNPGVYELKPNKFLPSGIYFIQLQTQEKTVTQKIIKLR